MFFKRKSSGATLYGQSTSRWLCTTLLASVSLTLPCSAAVIQQDQALSFGSFVLAGNDAISTLVIPYDEAVAPSSSYKLYPLSPGQPGHYSLSGFVASTVLIITINDFNLTAPGQELMTVTNFTFPAITTNGSGDAFLEVGATLSSTGSGTGYGESGYTGTMDIIISW